MNKKTIRLKTHLLLLYLMFGLVSSFYMLSNVRIERPIKTYYVFGNSGPDENPSKQTITVYVDSNNMEDCLLKPGDLKDI